MEPNLDETRRLTQALDEARAEMERQRIAHEAQIAAFEAERRQKEIDYRLKESLSGYKMKSGLHPALAGDAVRSALARETQERNLVFALSPENALILVAPDKSAQPAEPFIRAALQKYNLVENAPTPDYPVSGTLSEPLDPFRRALEQSRKDLNLR